MQPTSTQIANVDQLLRRGGLSVRDISRRTSVTWWRVYKYAKRRGIPLYSKRPPLTPGQQSEAARLVEIEGLSMSSAAQRIGASEMQVWRVVSRRRSDAVAQVGEFRPKRIRGGRRCPRHGIVYWWPCVACQAAANPAKPFNPSVTARAVR